MSTSTEVKVSVKSAIDIKPPPLCKVIYINDDVTTMEFVIDSLVNYFNHSPESALELTESIHESGSAVVAVLPHELAEQKGIEVTLEAHSQGYPLKIKLEFE